MFNFLKRLFDPHRNEVVDPDAAPEEYWQTNFRKPAQARFTGERGDSYAAEITPDGLELSFEKKNVYAWTVNPVYQYRDFVLESLIDFPSSGKEEKKTSSIAGTLAAGFLFRYLSETTFYSVLVSDGGLIRMDAVVNGTPVPVLGWTETDRGDTAEPGEDTPPYASDASVFSVRVIARGTDFTLIVNDHWTASCSDDTIQAAGRLAFAGQNWAQVDRARAVLKIVAVDSRPMEVETIATRWNQYIKIPPDAHINLARTWYAMGKYVPAILELKRAWKDREPGTGELLLSGQAYLAQRLLPEAEEQVRKVLSLDGTHEEACAELGGILYLQNRFLELDDLLGSVSRNAREGSAFLSNLEGHLLHWKGNHGGSAEAYARAAKLSPDQGLFSFHEGNEWNSAGNSEKAVEAWLAAARRFLADESYDDLSTIVDLLEKAAPDDARVASVAGKYCYATGRPDLAAAKLDKAIRAGSQDSGVWYLSGMLLSEGKRTDEAIDAFRKAVEIEGDYGPYRYRLAEILFFAGMDCDDELSKSLEIDPDNGWAHNLASLRALGEGDMETAERHILEARRLLPEERTILVNYAEIARRRGRLDEALPLLDTDDPEALRAGANLLVEEKRHEEAEDWYIKALRHRPFDAGLLTDRAANCLELDLLNEADDLLGRALDREPSPRIYQLIAYLGGRKGEYARSEVALVRGLEAFPENADLLRELAGVYVATNRLKKAEEVSLRFAAVEQSARTAELREEIADASTEKVSCDSCSRVWRVPKDIPPQGSLHLTAEPPDDLPAGTCPSCKSTFCIGCAKETLGSDGRFRCKKCGTPLKLLDQNIIWLLNRWQETEQ